MYHLSAGRHCPRGEPGVLPVRVALSEWDSKQKLGHFLPRPREMLTGTVDEAVAFAASVDAAVVAKVCGVAHKTEVGGVRTNLDPASLVDCWAELAGRGDGRVLVAEQVTADYELIVGGLRDAQFGPVLMFGLGGVLTEIISDVGFVLAPSEPGEVERALRGISAAALFDGYRGSPPLDMPAIERIAQAISDVLVADESVVEVECNPVAVVEGRPVVLDALIVADA